MNNHFSILRPYLRGLPIIVGAMVCGILFAKKYLTYVIPMYESTTKVKLADLQEGVTGNNLFKDFDVFASSNKIAGEIEVIKSQVLVEKALSKLDFNTIVSRIGKVKTVELYEDNPFVVIANLQDQRLYDQKIEVSVIDDNQYSISISKIDFTGTGRFGDTLKISTQDYLILNKNQDLFARKQNQQLIDNYELEFLSDDKLYQKIKGNLDVVPTDKDVAIIRIIYKSNIPKKATLFVNTLAKTYIEDYIDVKFKTADVTSGFLEKQIAEVYRKLKSSENRIEQYRDDKKIINIRQQTETDLRKLSQLKIQQTNVKMSLDAIEDLHKYIENGKSNFLELAPNFEAFTDLLSTEMVKKIKELQLEKTDLLLTYKEDTEIVKSIDDKIKYYTDYFIESIDNTYNNLRVKYDKLVFDIEEAEKAFIGLPEKEKILNILEREFQLQQKSYIFLNEKKIEAEIAKAAKLSFHRVITEASLPKDPVSPNRPIIIIVSGLMGLFGSIFLIFLVHSAKARVNDATTIEKNSDVPIIYKTPKLKNKKQVQTFFQRESLRMQMTNVIGEQSVVAFTSIYDNQGSLFHARQISETLALQGKKVLLICIDSAKVNKIEGVEVVNYESSVFIKNTFKEIEEFIGAFKLQYDFVIIKNECLNVDFISTVIMRIADLNLFVVDSRKTMRKRISDITLVRDKYQIPNFNFVLNREGYNPNIIKEIYIITKKLFTNKKQF